MRMRMVEEEKQLILSAKISDVYIACCYTRRSIAFRSGRTVNH